MQEESIYNLLIPEKISIPKGPIHRSAHDPKVVPTGSTFIHHTTSRPVVTNLNGERTVGPEAHTHQGNHITMGRRKGDYKPRTQEFVKKGTGRMGSNQLPDIKKFRYKTDKRRDPIPPINDKPIQGLKSNKNYIKSNIVENVTAAPKKLNNKKNWTRKKNYGKVPQYLERAKKRINEEYEYLRSMHQAEQENRMNSKYLMKPEEVEELRKALKRKWDHINREYQTITHIAKPDSEGLKRKKERCEHQLAQVERDLEKLNKTYIFVDFQT